MEDLNQKDAINKLLPGPITVVLNLKVPENGLNTVAIRYSTDKFISNIISYCHSPLYLTSANISGEEPISNFKEAFNKFSTKVDVYCEGKTSYDKPSTIISLTSDEVKILREGPISLEEILSIRALQEQLTIFVLGSYNIPFPDLLFLE